MGIFYPWMPSTPTYFEEYYEYPISKPLLLSIWIGWPAMRKHWPKTTFYQLLSFFVIVLAFFWILLLLYGNAVQASPPSFAFPSFLSLAGPSHRATCMLCNLVFLCQILADLAKHIKLLAILKRNLAWNGKRVREGLIKKIKATQVNEGYVNFFFPMVLTLKKVQKQEKTRQIAVVWISN